MFISLSFSARVSRACVSLSNGHQNISLIWFIYSFSLSFCVLPRGAQWSGACVCGWMWACTCPVTKYYHGDGSQCTLWDGSTAKTALGLMCVLNLLLISPSLSLHLRSMTLDYLSTSYFRILKVDRTKNTLYTILF